MFHIIDRVCVFLALSVSVFVLQKYLTSSDPYKCQALFEGQWLEPPKQWQPPGCMLHNYRSHDMTTCLEGEMAFIGDSTIREIFWAMAEKLDSTGSNRAMHSVEKHSDIAFSRDAIDLRFFWDPYLNTSTLNRVLASYTSDEAQRPTITIIGGGLWHARKLGKDSINHFNSAMDLIVSSITLRRASRESFPRLRLGRLQLRKGSAVAIAPVRIPQYRSLSADRAATITENTLNPLNEYLRQLSKDRGAPVAWSYSQMTSQQPLAYQTDGLHVVGSIAALQADILLNMRCNSVLSSLDTYPMSKTCCSSYAPSNWIQKTILVSSLGLLPLVTMVAAKGTTMAEALRGRQAKICTRTTSPCILPFQKSIASPGNTGTGTGLLLLCRSDSDVRQTPQAILIGRLPSDVSGNPGAGRAINTQIYAASHGSRASTIDSSK